ncbi:hypothetical protein G6F46_014506 [Rhizopus delemar]|nr:hypothetical protein G6F46_014506 [Rhizopus delemar]
MRGTGQCRPGHRPEAVGLTGQPLSDPAQGTGPGRRRTDPHAQGAPRLHRAKFIETEVKFEDGRSGKISADLKIRPVKTFPAITAKAA